MSTREYKESYLQAEWGNFYYYTIVPMLRNPELKNKLKSVSMIQLKDLSSKIEEEEFAKERAEIDAERDAAIDMGEYDIGQEKGMLNWLNDDAKLWEQL